MLTAFLNAENTHLFKNRLSKSRTQKGGEVDVWNRFCRGSFKMKNRRKYEGEKKKIYIMRNYRVLQVMKVRRHFFAVRPTADAVLFDAKSWLSLFFFFKCFTLILLMGRLVSAHSTSTCPKIFPKQITLNNSKLWVQHGRIGFSELKYYSFVKYPERKNPF